MIGLRMLSFEFVIIGLGELFIRFPDLDNQDHKYR